MAFDVKLIAPMTANAPDIKGFPVVYGYASTDDVSAANYFDDYHAILNKGDEIWQNNAGTITKYDVTDVTAGAVTVTAQA